MCLILTTSLTKLLSLSHSRRRKHGHGNRHECTLVHFRLTTHTDTYARTHTRTQLHQFQVYFSFTYLLINIYHDVSQHRIQNIKSYKNLCPLKKAMIKCISSILSIEGFLSVPGERSYET